MFRSVKPKTNKRRRVAEDEENTTDSYVDKDVAGVSTMSPFAPSTDRWCPNIRQTGGVKKAKNVLQTRLVESEREIVPQHYAGDATYETQIDTEKDRDARAVMERSIKANTDGSADTDSGKVYRGQAAYKSYITKKESQIGMNKYTGCKFLHDRGDYKSGWKIEQEYAEKEKKRQKRLREGRDADEESDEEDKSGNKKGDEKQFACTICRGPFRNALETICGHFFCEACALKHFKKSSRCYNCKKQTNGIFNVAEKLRAKEREQQQHTNAAETFRRSNCVATVTDVKVDAKDSSSEGWTKVTETS
uniref:RING-type domain-containing protein n=1 Tax=Hyaloperonospora arabidopsidis (strain Emoy2) TaxID=559515 RepID=M4BAI3_HYAAE